jgi:hypothetical protein
MTKLEIAFAAASKLPPSEQEALAELILQELSDEQRWTKGFSAAQDQLAQLADEALKEHNAGQSQRLDANRL